MRIRFRPILRRALGTLSTVHICLPLRSRPVAGERFFCQNSGSCGSAYIVELLKANGLGPSYHEKPPDLDIFGIDYYEGRIPDWRARAVLLQTRRGVYFEANNRLFAMSRALKEAFPDARFIHLHRDPRSYVPSALSKPPSSTWDSGRRRYRSEALSGPLDSPLLDRACTYWTRYNRRILEDLRPYHHLSLKSADLFDGNLNDLERFLGHELRVRRLGAVNADKAVRKEGQHPNFHDWSSTDQQTLYRICGPLMEELGYGTMASENGHQA